MLPRVATALAALTALAAVAFVRVASAGEVATTTADVAAQAVDEARQTFRLGVDFAKNGRWDDALAAFERSHRLRPHVVTLYNIGFCLNALGRFTAARRTLAEALAA